MDKRDYGLSETRQVVHHDERHPAQYRHHATSTPHHKATPARYEYWALLCTRRNICPPHTCRNKSQQPRPAACAKEHPESKRDYHFSGCEGSYIAALHFTAGSVMHLSHPSPHRRSHPCIRALCCIAASVCAQNVYYSTSHLPST